MLLMRSRVYVYSVSFVPHLVANELVKKIFLLKLIKLANPK
jgi:hypothetical protein